MSVARLILGALLQPAIFALLLFGGAGTLAWDRAWVVIAVTLVATVASLVGLRRHRPTLLVERFKSPLQKAQSRPDTIAVAFFAVTLVGAVRVIPEDVFRYGHFASAGVAAFMDSASNFTPRAETAS